MDTQWLHLKSVQWFRRYFANRQTNPQAQKWAIKRMFLISKPTDHPAADRFLLFLRLREIFEEELRLVRRVPRRADPQQVLPTDRRQRQPHSDRRERPPRWQSVRTAEELDAEAGAEGRHQRPAGGSAQHGPASLSWVHRLRGAQERLLQTNRHALKAANEVNTKYSQIKAQKLLSADGRTSWWPCSRAFKSQ